MPSRSAKASADAWLREPTAATTPESVSARSAAKAPAIPPVPMIPHRTGLPTARALVSGSFPADESTVVEAGVPVAPAGGRQVEQVPHRGVQVDAAFLDVLGHPRPGRVVVPDLAIAVTGEQRDRRVLVAVLVLAAQVALEGVVAAGKQPQLVPAA